MAADPNYDPFSAMGGGVYVNGGWVPKDHPGAQQAVQQQQGGAPGQPGAATTIEGQAQNAQTYSNNPGGATTQVTANQGTQDVVRNSYLQQATQGTAVNRNDPNFRQQADPFAANVDRAQRDYLADRAEQLGPYSSGALRGEQRMAAERGGIAKGQFESQLVARELQTRRDEIQNALTNLSGIISNDQQLALQKQLAELDAALKREGLSLQGSLGSQELGLKDKLGTGALNVDLMRALLQNQQFGMQHGLDVGIAEDNALYRRLFG